MFIFLKVFQLVGEAEPLLLEHVQDAHVLLLDRVALHQLQVRLVDLILQKPDQFSEEYSTILSFILNCFSSKC